MQQSPQAITLINRNTNFAEIKSYPCFEYWVLLHFTDCHTPFDACHKVGNKIKTENKGVYDKGDASFFNRIVAQHKEAAERARKREENPYTHVYKINTSDRISILFLRNYKGHDKQGWI